MHPLVRDLYKRVLHAGKDYPTGIDHVKHVWKAAIRNPRNCPSCYGGSSESLLAASASQGSRAWAQKIDGCSPYGIASPRCEQEIRAAVARGRHMVKEMIGVAQLKKYRSMLKRYGTDDKKPCQQSSVAAVGDQELDTVLHQLEERARDSYLG